MKKKKTFSQGDIPPIFKTLGRLAFLIKDSNEAFSKN